MRKFNLVGAFCLLLGSLLGVSPAQAKFARWTVTCTFTEPWASLSVSPTQVLLSDWTDPDSTLKNGRATATASSMTISGTLSNGEPFRGIVKRQPGGLGESGWTTDWSIESNFHNNRTAGCIRYSQGMTFHTVVNVDRADLLMVRASPNAQAKILGSVEPDSEVIVDPAKRSGSWIRAEFADLPGDSGPVIVLKGWVNRRFVSTKPNR